MAITYFGSASNPTDNGTLSAPSAAAVTPPSSMTANDLVLVFCQSKTATDDNLFRVSTTGGQSWFRLTKYQGTTQGMTLYACRFNGTWAANPQFLIDGVSTTAMTLVMHVFRPSSTSMIMDVDVSPVVGTFTAGSTPFTKTITGITTRHNGAVAIAAWSSNDDNTWDTLTSGWSTPGSAQYRNLSGTDQSMAFAYQIFATAGATGNVSLNQATLGGDAGTTCILSVFEYAAPTGAPTVDVYTDFEDSTDNTLVTATILGNATYPASPGGTWAFAGTVPANDYIENSAEKAFTGGTSVNVGATNYPDTSGTRGYRIQHDEQASVGKMFVFTKSSAVNVMSIGHFFYTDLDYGTDEVYTVSGIVDGGSSGLAALNFRAIYFDPPYGNVIEPYLENAISEIPAGPWFQRLTWYWVTIQYDYTNNITRLAFFDPATWAQVGFTAVGRAGSSPGQPVSINIGVFGGGLTAPAGKVTYFDDLIIDYTTGAFPLLPGVAAGSGGPTPVVVSYGLGRSIGVGIGKGIMY